MKILVEKRMGSHDISHIRVILRAGSVQDPSHQKGLAHFTARALLWRTQALSHSEFVGELERLGGSLRSVADSTWTVFQGAVLSENLQPFLALFSEVLTRPVFEPSDTETLRRILQGEIRVALQDPDTVAAQALQQTTYVGTPLETSPSGSVRDLESIRSEDLQGFYRTHYHRENAIAAIVTSQKGDVEEWLASTLAPLPGRRSPGLVDPVLPAPTAREPRAVVALREGVSSVPLWFCMPGVADNDSHILGLEAANRALGVGEMSRLFQRMRAQTGWTYTTASSLRMLLSESPQPVPFAAMASPSEDVLSEAIPAFLQVLQSFFEEGINQKELDDAREAMIHSYPFQWDTAEKRLGLRIRAALTGRPFLSAENYIRALRELTVRSINGSLRSKLPFRNWRLAAVGQPDRLRPIFEKLPGIQGVDLVEIEP